MSKDRTYNPGLYQEQAKKWGHSPEEPSKNRICFSTSCGGNERSGTSGQGCALRELFWSQGKPIESQSKPGSKMVYPEQCKELRRRPQLSGWDCPLLTFVYPGFDCGSIGKLPPGLKNFPLRPISSLQLAAKTGANGSRKREQLALSNIMCIYFYIY